MQNFYREKTVLITGASSGIGEAMSKMLASMGSFLILTSENGTELSRVGEECRKLGAVVQTKIMDQSDPVVVDNIIENIIRINKQIDVVILNAGISQRDSVNDTEIAVHDKIMQVNFRSNVQIVKKLLPLMLSQGRGYIGITSSISGKFGFHLRSTYAASKHALHGFFESLSIEYRMQNIFVSIICPGRVRTNISRHALHGDGSTHGKMDKGQSGGISAERCAHQYLKAIKDKRREKLIGGKELLMAYFKRYVPCIFYALAQKIKPM